MVHTTVTVPKRMGKAPGEWGIQVERFQRIVAACAAILVLTVGVAATGTASSGAAESTAPIVVSGVWSQASYAGADVGFEAAINAFNAAGGLDGRKVKFIGMQEDGASVTQDLSVTKTLVNEHVFAVAPIMTEAWESSAVLQKAQIPGFGWGTSTGWWGQDSVFSFVGDNPPKPTDEKNIISFAQLICRTVQGGCKGKTVAEVSINNASAITSVNQFGAEFKEEGAKVVQENTSIPEPPAAVSDYSPYANALLSSNHGKQPDLILQILPPGNDAGLAKELQQLGYSGKDYNFSLYDPRIASVAKGTYTIMQFSPWEENTPAVKLMTQRVKATDPNAILSQPTAAGYIIGLQFIAALKKVGPSVTPAKMLKVLNSGWTFSAPGLSGPITFPSAHAGLGGCEAIVHGTGTGYTVALPCTVLPPIPNPLLKK
jgi:branched-chain amino acid transport system substrate-binding protein